ncbi:hypothetical protein NLX62_05305 [Mycobacteriaceae bacterium Msp059]|nr:hypothetical protein [Mycobacteriaceae bacterium Msp059]
MVLAIVVAVAITVLVVRPSDGKDTPPESITDFASANDTGPANIIAEDPTCNAWGRITREYNAQSKSVNWADRDTSVPATGWTLEQRTMYEAMSKAMTNAADQTAALVKRTPHRVMRELFEQFIAYVHAFVPSVPAYAAENNRLVATVNALANSATDICSAIEYESAPSVADEVAEPAPPSHVEPISDSGSSERFLMKPNRVCSEWASAVTKFDNQTRAWQALDPKIAAADWSAEQKSTIEKTKPVMSANADNLERLGRESGNPAMEDFAVLAAQYQRGYLKAVPSYTSADNSLWQAVASLVKSVASACNAAV